MEINSKSINITPPNLTKLAGYSNRPTDFDKVDSDLEINGIRLVQNRKEVFIISIDTLFVTDELVDDLIALLSPQYSLKKEQIILFASHTHYAPSIDKSKPKLGEVDSEYYTFVLDQLKLLVLTLLKKSLTKVDIYLASQETKGIMISRRKLVWVLRKKIIPWRMLANYPNHNEEIDSNLSLIYFKEHNTSKVHTVLWNIACHPVMYHFHNHLSGHFPSDIRQYIRKKHNVPILFLQGFSGDVRPLNLLTPKTCKEKLLTKINKTQPFQNFTEATYSLWVEKMIDYYFQCESKLSICTETSALDKKHFEAPLNDIWNGKTEDKVVTFNAIFLNKSTVILGVSAEVVAHYSLALKKLFPSMTIIPVGCMGYVFGYWPNNKMLSEKGYEVVGFVDLFSLKGRFKPDVEHLFWKGITYLTQ